ncbi:TnsA-like heteromeric transposase endonuclease subunit [Streptomyces odonnellii]|uniref:TnsA-like heteromeric transposase endonuclease subunit n=1 Tax=Streptomyces odonnellii TaxID=1417980 RepID=UPI0006266E7A|nr:TnsA-like heteromeric transposase endonuclease subunit [Streptomyces odonnellii]
MAVEAFADVGHGVFEVEYVDGERVRRREALSAAWTVRFESLPPVRKVRTYDGQRSVTRDYWSTTVRKALACESRLERDHAMLMDFDPRVTALVSQPYRLFWPGRRGRLGHVPDFFARLADGTGVVVDVRPDDQIEPDDARRSRRPSGSVT